MSFGIQRQVLLVSLIVTLVSVLVTGLYLTRGLDADLSRRVEKDLFVRLDLVARQVVAVNARLDSRSAWDAVADELGRRAQGRVSIIARDGTVLGDSELDLEALARVENHANRPEIIQALAEQRGSSRRFSNTLGQRMLYVAEPFQVGGQTVGSVRLAVPLTEVDEAIGRLRGLVLTATGLGLTVAALLGSLIAHWVSHALRSVTDAARRMAAGDLAVRVHTTRNDEVAELARALNGLAGNLSSALDELRGERDVLGGVLDGMREGVLLLDREGRIVLANPALRQMLMLGADVTGKLPLEIVRSSDLQRVFDQVASTQDVATAELELGDLETCRLMVRAAPFANSGGALAVFIDVTELRRLETVRRDFVANVSHELRTPVAAVRSAAETLRTSGLVNETALDFLAMIERNTERLQHLLADLLDLAQIESRELKLDMQPTFLAEAVERACGLVHERAERKRLELGQRIDDELEVCADLRRRLKSDPFRALGRIHQAAGTAAGS